MTRQRWECVRLIAAFSQPSETQTASRFDPRTLRQSGDESSALQTPARTTEVHGFCARQESVEASQSAGPGDLPIARFAGLESPGDPQTGMSAPRDFGFGVAQGICGKRSSAYQALFSRTTTRTKTNRLPDCCAHVRKTDGNQSIHLTAQPRFGQYPSATTMRLFFASRATA